MINPDVNRKSARKKFSVDDRVRIENLLTQSDIDEIHQELQSVPFDLVYVLDGKVQTTSREKMSAMTDSEKSAINENIISNASRGEGFLYDSCHMGVGRPAEVGKKMVELFDFIQSEEMLSFVRTVTGDNSLSEVTGHYTRYQPGHFLTRHRDVVEDRQRRFAYVLSFTPNWHPDWGGLLQFYEEDGAPKDSWAPVYNSLTLFDVRHIHAVTYVTPFATEPRLSLTGWFRAS